ncbi:aminotransferase class IV [Chloroflexota bacterium]
MNEVVYLSGSLIPLSQASISVLDYGFLYGFGLFETMRAYGGYVFRLDNHLRRLARSAEILGLPIGEWDLKGAVMDTIQANELSEARIRLTVSMGEGAMVPDPSTCGKPTVVVVAQPYQPYPEAVYQKGFRSVVSSIRRNSQSPVPRFKSVNFLESMLAKQEARAAGVDDALFLNDRSLLAEASTSNIFLATNGGLKTPGLESGILPGTTREAILELASALGINVHEQEMGLDELRQAEEAFLTNAMVEVMPLTEVEGRPVGSGMPGPLTKRLIVAYKELVLQEIGKRAR